MNLDQKFQKVDFILVLSFRRSGTHLTIDTILNNFRDVSSDYINLDQLNPSHKDHLSPEEFKKKVISEAGISQKRVVLKSHLERLDEDWGEAITDLRNRVIEKARIVYVQRDPKDLLCSLWQYIGSHSPEYHTESSFEEHIATRLPRIFQHRSYWQNRAVLTVNFEDYVVSSGVVLEAMSEKLNLDRKNTTFDLYSEGKKPGFKEKILQRIFSQRVRRTSVNYNPGQKIGRWKDQFTAREFTFYQELISELKNSSRELDDV